MSDKTERILICGAGSVGSRHIRNLRSLGYSSIAVYRRRYEPLDSDPAPVYTDLQKALSEFAPQVAFVTNPTALHVPVALECAKAGCHLFIEKPVSHTLDGLKELAKHLNDRGRIGMVGYMLRFHPLFQQVKAWIDAGPGGPIGSVLYAHACWGENVIDFHPWEDFRTSYAVRPELGGSAPLTLCHDLDLMVWMMGTPVAARSIFAPSHPLDTNSCEAADYLLQFAEGAVGHVHMDYWQRPQSRSWDIVGTAGRVTIDYHAGVMTLWRSDVTNGAGNLPSPAVFEVPEGYERNQMFCDELRYFFDCITRNCQASPSIEEGAIVVKIATSDDRETKY